MLNTRSIICFTLLISFGTTQVLGSTQSLISVTVKQSLRIGKFQTGIGSRVELKSEDPKSSGEALFLGKAIRPVGTQSFQMYLHLATKKVLYIEANLLKSPNIALQTVLDPYEQAGGTCTGYAIYDYLQQLNLTGFKGSGELVKSLETEEGRTTLLVDSVNQYYLNLQHRNSINGILNSYGKKFGFQCKNFKTNTYSEAKSIILKNLSLGNPVIFSFYTGPKMYKSPFPLSYYLQPNPELDDRLWVPRKTGERNSGGHSNVAAASFELEGKNYLVMLDSDWSQPRIWDMDAFLGERMDLSEIDFIFCK